MRPCRPGDGPPVGSRVPFDLVGAGCRIASARVHDPTTRRSARRARFGPDPQPHVSSRWPARRSATSRTISRKRCSVSGYADMSAIAPRMKAAGTSPAAALIAVTALSGWLVAPCTYPPRPIVYDAAAAPIAWPTLRVNEKIEYVAPSVREPVFHSPYSTVSDCSAKDTVLTPPRPMPKHAKATIASAGTDEGANATASPDSAAIAPNPW